MPRWPVLRFMRILPLLLALLGAWGCVDRPDDGGLYVFDNSSRSILVWKDLDKVHEAAQARKPVPAADRTLTSQALEGITLAWGGMALDSFHKSLYLV